MISAEGAFVMRSIEDEERRQMFVWPAQPRARDDRLCVMFVTRP